MSSTTIENYVYLVTDATKASSGECDKYDYECNNSIVDRIISKRRHELLNRNLIKKEWKKFIALLTT